MFPRGSRFEPTKVSDVPGPNSYNIPTESQLDAYKRGAFLEKAKRFDPDAIVDDAPLPTETTKSTAKNTIGTRPTPNLTDRYAVLQKKVEDLERVHKEDKRTHRGELDRLKLELVNAQKTNADLVTRLDKYKKHDDAQTARIAELVKVVASDKAEAKELRVKLRSSEHERTQLASKQGDATELKKAVQAADAKRKDEVREREKKIAELEKVLVTEKKRREMAEACCLDLRTQTKEEVDSVRVGLSTKDAELATVQRQLDESEAALDASRLDCDSIRTELTRRDELEAHMVDAYSGLVGGTVSRATYDHLHYAHAATQWHAIRLERKLANVEGQVVELAHLLRHMKEDRALAKAQLRDAHAEIHFLQSTSRPFSPPSKNMDDLELAVFDIERNMLASSLEATHAKSALVETSSQLSCVLTDELITAYALAQSELEEFERASAALDNEFKVARIRSEHLEQETLSAQSERDQARRALEKTDVLVEDLRGQSDKHRAETLDAVQKLADVQQEHSAAVQEEKSVAQQLRAAIQRHLMAEEGLRSQIDCLTSELASMEQLQESYQQLSHEVGELITRNALAEDVAKQLSKFNAEIVGHRNPAQRIMYLERIRNELAESRQKLAVLTRERDGLLAQREGLANEVDMYKSVAVHDKPRSTITRVNRVPLGTLNSSGTMSTSTKPKSSEKPSSILDMIPDTTHDDMTLDELMT